MNSQKGYVVNVIVTGFMAVVVLSTVLFVGRYFCIQPLLELMPQGMPPEMARAVRSPSGLLGDWDQRPDRPVTEPNAVAKPSLIDCGTSHFLASQSLGIFQYLETINQDRSHQLISPGTYRTREKDGVWRLVYFDKSLGLFVNCDIVREGIDDKGRWKKNIESYLGPKGISNKPDTVIGRFTKPLIRHQSGIIFDRKLSQFVRIDFDKKVKTGPKVERKIVQVGRLIKNDGAMWGPIWRPPQRRTVKYKTRPNGQVVEYVKLESIQQEMFDYYLPATGSELVLDNSGMIYKLSMETLELEGPIGELPWPGVRGSLAYEVKPLCIQDSYAGLIAGGIGPDIFRPGFLVFDEAGNRIGEERGDIEFLKFAGGPALSITNFVLETLQPTILQLVTYFTALRFDGADGPRSLFVLPNSLVGRKGAALSQDDILEYILGLWVIFPSVAISLLLAWRVEKDARKIGLSPRAKSWWMVATVTFGLAAYITYRLTRPRLTLVTCANCGRPRRPDMDRCHQCGSKWLVPELIAPLWRVIEKPQPGEGPALSPDQPDS